MTFIPDTHTLLLYTAACLVLFLTPGPDMSLWIVKTLTGGRRSGLAAMAGTNVGCLVHTLFVAVGLSALLAASAAAFGALKIVGALYLAWLAIQAIRSGSALNVATDGRPAGSIASSFLVGLGLNITNPQVVLFFVTFLPQFVAADDPHAAGKLVFLGLYFIGINLPFCVLLVLGAERVTTWLRGRPRVLRGIDYGFAGIFGFFAMKILAAQSR